MTTIQLLTKQNKDLRVEVKEYKDKLYFQEIEHKKEITRLNKIIDKQSEDIKSLINTVNILNAKVDALIEENKILRAENALLKEENKKLKDDNDRMRKILNNNSSNTSIPPSASPKKNIIPNNRKCSKKRIGGQKYHTGNTLDEKSIKEKISNNELKYSEIIIKVKGLKKQCYQYQIGYEFIPTATKIIYIPDESGEDILEHINNSRVIYDTSIKSLVSLLSTEGYVSINRISKLISMMSNGVLNIAKSSIFNFIKELSKKSQNILENIKQELLNSNILHTDATTTRCDGKNMCVRNYSNNSYTYLSSTISKSDKCIEEEKILSIFTGGLVHDHEVGMYKYGTEHAECNVHIGRYCKGVYENTKNKWGIDLYHFLCGLNRYKKRLIEQGVMSVSDNKLEEYKKIYDEFIERAYVENSKVKSNYYRKEEKKLIDRLKKYKLNHLMFLINFDYAFDNNLSERELRHVKTKLKISGTFRKIENCKIYTDIKSIIITCKKKGNELKLLDILAKIFDNDLVSI